MELANGAFLGVFRAGVAGRVLIVPRFDRRPVSHTKIHFEEFNQLLGRRSGEDKYDASYEDMGKFIRTTPGCTPVDAWRLYRRILTCFLTGNTDAHLKNFAPRNRTTDVKGLGGAKFRCGVLSCVGAGPSAAQALKPAIRTWRPKAAVPLSATTGRSGFGKQGTVLNRELIFRLRHN